MLTFVLGNYTSNIYPTCVGKPRIYTACGPWSWRVYEQILRMHTQVSTSPLDV